MHCGSCSTMSMPLSLFSPLSLSSKNISFFSSSLHPYLSTLSPLPLLLRPSKTLTLTLTLTLFSPSQHPIFLNHLQLIEENHSEDNKRNEEEDLDPIRTFFKSLKPIPDPKHEGRRTWHIKDIVDPAESDLLDEQDLFQSLELKPSAPLAEDGVVGDVLRIARNVPENSTLGDLLDSFVGKIALFECVEVLERMGEEGFVWSCLFFFEWMGLQEPSLVTGRACNVLFTVLGKAGMGEKLMVLFENLPREKRFRDVRVYNAAISGLSCCGR